MKILIADQSFVCRCCGKISYTTTDALSGACGSCVSSSDVIAATRPQNVDGQAVELPKDPDRLKEALFASKNNDECGISAEEALLAKEMEKCGVPAEQAGVFRADEKLRILLSKACMDKGAARQMRARLNLYSIIAAGSGAKLAAAMSERAPDSILRVAMDETKPTSVRCEAFAQCLAIAGLNINVD